MEQHKKERIDELERYYRPIELCETWTTRLFWVSAVLSVLVLYSQWIPWKDLRDIPTVLFCVSVTLHLLLSLYNRFHLVPAAEAKRRKQLLSDSFDVPLTPEQTQAYYNNPLAPSVKRLGANVLENSFFAKSVCGKMAVRERAKVLIYFTAWLLAVFWRNTPLGLVMVVTQTIFSGEIIARLISLEVLRHRNEELYDELYHEFLHKIDFQSPVGMACILDAFASYEAVKAAAGIKQSSKIFKKLNPTLTSEWDTIRDRLGINNKSSNNAMHTDGYSAALHSRRNAEMSSAHLGIRQIKLWSNK